MTGSVHVALAALGAAIGVGLIGMSASTAVGRNPGASTKILVQSILAIAFAEAIVFYALFLGLVESCWSFAAQVSAESGGQIAEIARTFGVDWPHLGAQIISFGIMCAVLYLLAYKPILRMLEARRQQIAGGLANAAKIKAELARIDAERLEVLAKADAEGKRLIDEARAAAARVQADETQKAIAAAEQILARARETTERERAGMLAELKREVGRLVVQTTATVTGKILTPDDHRRLAEETAGSCHERRHKRTARVRASAVPRSASPRDGWTTTASGASCSTS